MVASEFANGRAAAGDKEGVAEGELRGTGTWRLSEAGDVVRVSYAWNVTTTQAWMRWSAPLLRPLFRWNHDAVMRAGGLGLARRLQVRLLD